jgi:hypothetical protein
VLIAACQRWFFLFQHTPLYLLVQPALPAGRASAAAAAAAAAGGSAEADAAAGSALLRAAGTVAAAPSPAVATFG